MSQNTQQETLATLTDEVIALKQMVGVVQKDVSATKELVEAWAAVKTVGRFIKWFSGIATGLAALWLLTRVGLTHIIGGSK